MSRDWKSRKKFIRDWAVIWICCISLVALVNMLMCVQVYTKKCEDKLLGKFETYCVDTLEREVGKYE